MRLRVSFCLLLAALSLQGASRYSFQVMGEAAGGWPAILSSLGFVQGGAEAAGVVVVPHGATVAGAAYWQARVERGTILILEGDSPLAAAFGFHPAKDAKTIAVQNVEDLRAPELRIIWKKSLDVTAFDMPAEVRVFARERHQKLPLLAGYKKGAGAVLWIVGDPGPRGYERFPYIPQALADLGLEAPFRSGRLWAFFDSSYRSRADLDYLAKRWRAAGIGALHVAAWHYWERDPQNDEYLKRLMEACHHNAIQVYAWIELPHVSEKFWNDHPEWREKTAMLQDARLDWRELMNLTSRPAFNAVTDGLRDLLTRFDWDGVNLAELYFESLEGVDNPARLTPMNDDVRAEFRAASGFDPLDLFKTESPQHWSKNPSGLKAFLDFRGALAQRQQTEWIAQIETIRKSKPQLDLTLTHIDDRFDGSMREKLGADTSRVLPLLGQHDFTFLIEDPATIWNQGPQRYPLIASRYTPATPAQDKLAIDINVVERYQDVYPTKQQTGSELFEEIHAAAGAFPRVAMYFENSILRQDLPWLGSAAASVDSVQQTDGKLTIVSKHGAGVPFAGPSLVDGKPWPFVNGDTVWLPRGAHTVDRAAQAPVFRILDFNGELKSASASAAGVDFAYQSNARALAVLDRVPTNLEIDGAPAHPEMEGMVLLLPKGQHLVSLQ